VLATIGLRAIILAESALSLPGFGVPSSYPSLGACSAAPGGRSSPRCRGWLSRLGVVGFTMLCDALRDVLAPATPAAAAGACAEPSGSPIHPGDLVGPRSPSAVLERRASRRAASMTCREIDDMSWHNESSDMPVDFGDSPSETPERRLAGLAVSAR